ncbi:DUF4123 domain-containing protein [Marinobacter metalliresistant]|uniref:DUF4123 domain-containing protein n=1 Tax=Marinobacter metalliresistant TaxID=2961995 RepID=A0ABZ2W0W8_9GAMM
MDAANYISTLDRLELLNQEPFRADFAFIDLAVDERFLQFLYDSDRQGAVHWRSLLENTRWQASWQAGPVFLEFAGDSHFRDKLKERLTQLPLGILVESSESPEQVFEWAQGWLLALADSDERLFRFYDPRSFRPLMATLQERSRSMVNPGAAIYWSQSGAWYAYRSAGQTETGDAPEGISLSQAELLELPGFRLADRAMVYTNVYRDYLPYSENPGVWVLEQLQEANSLGFESASLQERWLRLRIRNGAPLLGRLDYREIMNKPDMTPADRLNAMESILESTDATT